VLKIKRLKDTVFFETYSLIRKNLNNYLKTLFFDFIFLIIIFLVGQKITPLIYTLQSDPVSLFSAVVGYYLVLLFLYSIIKCMIIGLIISKKFVIKDIFRMFRINLTILFVILAVSLILLTALNYLFIANFFKVISVIYLLILLFYFYPFMNHVHLNYIKNNYLKKSFTFIKKIKRFIPVYLWTAGLFLVFLLISGLSSLLFHGASWYLEINRVLTIIFGYLVFAFNRYYLYIIIKEVK